GVGLLKAKWLTVASNNQRRTHSAKLARPATLQRFGTNPKSWRPWRPGGSLPLCLAGREGAPRVAGDHELVVGGDDAHGGGASVGADDLLRGTVSIAVDVDAEVLETGADAFAHGRGVLSDASREDERVEPAERRRESAERLSHLIGEHLE